MKKQFKQQKSCAKGLTKNNADYFANLKGGRYHKIITKKIIEIPNSTDLLEKETTIIGRLKVDYYKLKSNKGKQTDTTRTNNFINTIPHCIKFNTNTERYSLQVIVNENQKLKSKSTYTLNGKVADKETLIKSGILKEKKQNIGNYLTVGLDTIVEIK